VPDGLQAITPRRLSTIWTEVGAKARLIAGIAC